MVWDRPAIVVVAVGHDRVTVVFPAHHQVQLIAALGPHLVVPQPALRIERNAQRVAVAQRPHLRGHAPLVGERIVRGDAAVVVQAHDLAHVRLHVLRRVELLPVARADPEHAIVEGNAVRVMALAGHLRDLAPDDFDVLERAPAAAIEHQPRAGHGGAGGIALAGLGVADVHELVAVEPGMQHHVAQAALAAVGHRRYAGDLAAEVAVDVIHQQPARLLGHQQAPVGQESHRPRFVEPGHLFHLEGPILALSGDGAGTFRGIGRGLAIAAASGQCERTGGGEGKSGHGGGIFHAGQGVIR